MGALAVPLCRCVGTPGQVSIGRPGREKHLCSMCVGDGRAPTLNQIPPFCPLPKLPFPKAHPMLPPTWETKSEQVPGSQVALLLLILSSVCFSGMKLNIRAQQPHTVSSESQLNPSTQLGGLEGRGRGEEDLQLGGESILRKKNVLAPFQGPWEQSPGLWIHEFPFPVR